MNTLDNNPLLRDKLDEARRKFPADYKYLADLEIDLSRKIEEAHLLNIPIVKELLKDAKERVGTIDFLLAYDPDLNKPTDEARIYREGLRREREAHVFWFRRFNIKDEDELVTDLISFLDSRLST